MSDNPSFILNGIQNVVIAQRPIPEIKPHEILVEVKKTGICGSDIHFYAHGRIADTFVKDPMVLGHESSGVVAQVGANVKHLKPGDRVALEPGSTCYTCDDCKAGRYQLCPAMVFASTPPNPHGTLARYYCLPGDVAYKLPDNLTLEDGAMIEPLSVAVHAIANIANFRTNQTIAVWGAGPVGLLCMATAKALGASRIIAVDILQSRLDFAKGYVATQTFLPPAPQENETKMNYSRRSAALMQEQLGIEERGSNSIDLVVDASGVEVSIQTAMHIVKTGGTYVQVGMGMSGVQLPITAMLVKEINFRGSLRYGPGDYQFAIALVSRGEVDLKPLVTHRFPFTEAEDAFKTTQAGKSADGKGAIKVIISGPYVLPTEV